MITITLQEIIEDMDTAFLVKIGKYVPWTIICDEDETRMSGIPGYNGVHKLYTYGTPVEDICAKKWLEINPFSGRSMGRKFSASNLFSEKDTPPGVIFTVIPYADSQEYSPSVELQQKQVEAFSILQNGKLTDNDKALALYEMMLKFWGVLCQEEDDGSHSENEWAAFYDQLEEYVIELDPELWRKRNNENGYMELPTLRNY